MNLGLPQISICEGISPGRIRLVLLIIIDINYLNNLYLKYNVFI